MAINFKGQIYSDLVPSGEYEAVIKSIEQKLTKKNVEYFEIKWNIPEKNRSIFDTFFVNDEKDGRDGWKTHCTAFTRFLKDFLNQDYLDDESANLLIGRIGKITVKEIEANGVEKNKIVKRKPIQDKKEEKQTIPF